MRTFWVFTLMLAIIFVINIVAAISILLMGYAAQSAGELISESPLTWIIVCIIGVSCSVGALVLMLKSNMGIFTKGGRNGR